MLWRRRDQASKVGSTYKWARHHQKLLSFFANQWRSWRPRLFVGPSQLKWESQQVGQVPRCFLVTWGKEGNAGLGWQMSSLKATPTQRYLKHKLLEKPQYAMGRPCTWVPRIPRRRKNLSEVKNREAWQSLVVERVAPLMPTLFPI